MNEKTNALDKVNSDDAHDNDVDQPVPVYDVELMDEAEDTGMVPKNDPPPVRSLAEKIGRAAGAALAILGFFADVRRAFRSSGGSGGASPKCDGTGRGMGRGIRRGEGRGMGRNRKNRRRT
jgi:hypothetical protein